MAQEDRRPQEDVQVPDNSLSRAALREAAMQRMRAGEVADAIRLLCRHSDLIKPEQWAELHGLEQVHHPHVHPLTGADLVVLERKRQLLNGWSLEHDREHTAEELALAALCYLTPPGLYPIVAVVESPKKAVSTALTRTVGKTVDSRWVYPWPFDTRSPDNRSGMTKGRRVADLAVAGAFIAAEIDRLQSLPDDPYLSEVKP